MSGNFQKLPDYVDFALPLPSLSPVAYTCSDDFETKFSPESEQKAIIKLITRSISKTDSSRSRISCPSAIFVVCVDYRLPFTMINYKID